MAHLMEEIAVERLAVDELCLFWDDDLIACHTVVGIVARSGFDGTDIEVLVYHRVNLRQTHHALVAQFQCAMGLLAVSLVEFRTRLLHIGLVNIEHIIYMLFWKDGELVALLVGELLVVLIFDALIRLLMDAGEGGDHHGRALLAFVHTDVRQFVAVLVREQVQPLAFLVLGKVHVRDTVEGGIARRLPSVFLLQEHQDDAVHAVVVTAIEVAGQLCGTGRDPRLLPVLLEIANFVNHDVGKDIQGAVLGAQAVGVGSVILSHSVRGWFHELLMCSVISRTMHERLGASL